MNKLIKLIINVWENYKTWVYSMTGTYVTPRFLPEFNRICCIDAPQVGEYAYKNWRKSANLEIQASKLSFY